MSGETTQGRRLSDITWGAAMMRRPLEFGAAYLLAGAAIVAARIGFYRRDGRSRTIWIPAWHRSPLIVSVRRRTGYSWASVIGYVGSTGREFRCRALRMR